MHIAQREPEAAPGTGASLGLRLAAMVYEAILLFGVAFAAGYAVLASMQWSYPLSPAQRAVVQAVLFVAIGLYFVVCWTRGGQTLALKAWHLRVVDASGQPPRVARAFWRYMLAWHLWLPGIAIAALLGLQVPQALAVITASFAALLVPAMFDRDRRLLHDRWTGTRVIRVPA